MDWFSNLFFGTGIAHSIFVLSLAIAAGIFLGTKLKIKGITLGITWILFCAIACSHFGMTLDPLVESFAKDLGLILFDLYGLLVDRVFERVYHVFIEESLIV